MYEQVIGFVNLYVSEFYIAAKPKGFQGIGKLHVFQFYAVHFAEHLRCFHYGIRHLYILRVPKCGTGTFCEETVLYGEAIVVPVWVFPFEAAVHCHNIATFFQCGLACMDGYIFQLEVVSGKQRAFASEFFVFNYFHDI